MSLHRTNSVVPPSSVNPETLTVTFGRTPIVLSVRRSAKVKAIVISVDGLRGIIATVPPNIDDSILRRAVLRRARWILDKQARTSESVSGPAPKEFLSGEKLLYLGRWYPLHVQADHNAIRERV